MSFSNPRRTPAVTRQAMDVGSSLTLKTNMTLRKGATFHSPNSPVSSSPDDFIPPPLVRRSQTNLDDVVDAHRRRVALIVDNIDKSLSMTDDLSSPTKKSSSFRDTSLPVPRGFLDPPVVDPAMAKQDKDASERRVLRPRHRRSSRNHESDSGLGTSVASTNDKEAATMATKKVSAITRSAAASSATVAKLPGLSSKAVNRIHEHVLRPLRAKPSLKDFEPIILDIPRRIHEKEIICLRDLEKTLIFMAPERTKTAALYLDFCLTSIRCIQATVEYLSDREQIRPSDRPYTNGYFIDLVDQIRQYARELASVKEKAAEGGKVDEMDVDLTDEIKLFGGINQNGRPAELVRVRRDGKAISMATGLPVDIDEDVKHAVSIKRSLSEQLEDEEEIMRSMARRKKNASPEELAPKKCREPGCNKEFKRPCDLTKHEKTHSRPWKCPVPTCKYHEYGWPTEKEMDRHHNDKHSSAPPMYECLYKPCPYKSKRESNCKQHMEKAHGWTYHRTKTNGKKGSSKPGSVAQATPQLGSMPTPSSNDSIATPPEEHAPMFLPYSDIEFPTYISDEDFMSAIGPHHPNMDDLQLDMSPLDQHTPSDTSSYGPYSAYQDGPDFTLNEDIYSAHAQLPTPDQAAYGKLMAQLQTFQPHDICQDQPVQVVAPAPHISPIGQGNAMLFTPNSLADVDEGFEDYSGNNTMGPDFQLFDTAAAGKAQYEPLFGEVPSAGLGYSQPSQDIFPAHMDWTSGDYSQYQEHH